MNSAIESDRPWVSAAATSWGARLALVAGEKRWTFVELASRAECIAAALARRGVRHGDRVALLDETTATAVACVHATAFLGASLVPLGPRLPFAELAASLDQVEARILVAGEGFRLLGERAAAVSHRGSSVDVATLSSLIDAPASLPPEFRVRIEPNAVHSIVFTSGTTGPSKAAKLTYENYASSAAATAERLSISADDVWLAPMPLHHVGGLSILTRSLRTGFRVVLLARFDAKAACDALAGENVTLVSVVPTMLHAMLDELDVRGDGRSWQEVFPSLRVVLAGGGPMSKRLADRALCAGAPLVTTYGLSETASQVSTSTVAETAGDPTHCGRPLDGLEIRIRDPDSNGFGALCVRGPQVFAGYVGGPARSRDGFEGDWFVTGDIASVDAGGHVRIAMRREDRIVTGGENVSPAEVESVLCEHPDVRAAGVYGLADDKWGQVVAAAVVLRSGVELDARALELWCRERLAAFKVPRRYAARDSLPTTAAGKLRRFLLPNE